MKNFLHIVRLAICTLIVFTGSNSKSVAQNWDQIIKANASDRNIKPASTRGTDEFGYDISISGDYAAVGAPSEEADANGQNAISKAGAVYILHLTNGKWKQVKKISPSVRGVYYQFGFSVAISGENVIVGVPREKNLIPGTSDFDKSGAAYIFSKDEGGEDNWGEVKRLMASVPALYNDFGTSVSISGDYAVVGDHYESTNGTGVNKTDAAGAAYVFKKSQGGAKNWGQIKKIVASDRAYNDRFGSSVAISGDNIVVGAPFDDALNASSEIVENAGSAYVFSKNQGGADNWGQVKKLALASPLEFTFVGGKVAISGDDVVIGYTTDPGHYDFPEAVYIYSKNKGGSNNWGLSKTLASPTPGKVLQFGASIAISSDYIIVGAMNESLDGTTDIGNSYAGSAFIFKKTKGGNDNWGQVKKLTPANREGRELYGYSVAIDGGLALVGSWQEQDDENEMNEINYAGATFLYQMDKGGADNWGFVKKSVTEELTPEDQFGYSVSISGNYAVVGSPNDDEGRYWQNSALDAGAAYVFYNDAGAWKHVTKLTPATRWAHDNFGASVSINGKYIIVGAPQGNLNTSESNYLENSGAAYIFYLEQGEHNWQQIRKLSASNRHAGDLFGQSVSMGENMAVVGAPGTDGGVGSHNYGSAYVFAKDLGSVNNWGEMQELTATERIDNAEFGRSVSISGNHVIAGANGDAYNYRGTITPTAGTAYIFQNGFNGVRNWSLVKQIHATTPTNGDQFGYSVSISGAYAIVGAFGESQNVTDTDYISKSGSAYIFKKDQGGADNWGEVKKITAVSRYADDNFGFAVSITGQYAIVGAPGADLNIIEETPVANAGASYIFRRDQSGTDNWGIVQKIAPVTRRSGNQFGLSVAMGDMYALVGTPFDDKDAIEQNTLEDAGSMYIFHTTSAPLPVKLAAFTVDKIENSSLLKWETTSETNSDHFEIEKSTDTKTWKKIGEVTAGAESTGLLTYSFTDNEPAGGNNFYRLKMVDQDGTFAYSRIRSVSFENSKSIGVYPNPVVDRLYVNADQLNKVESIRIINAFGQIVSNTFKITDEGLTLGNITNGIYIIQIKKTDGKMQAEKVVVAR